MSRKLLWLMMVSLIVVAADQYSKFRMLEALTTAFENTNTPWSVFTSEAPAAGFDGYHFRPKDQIVISDSFFRLRYAENPGAAFGLFRTLPDNIRGPLFHLISLGAIVLIAYYFSQLKWLPIERWARFGLPLVLGGAIGNYLDRLARGFVIDFLEAHWFEKAYWPAFNIADAAICVGVGFLVIDSFVRKEIETPSIAVS